MRVKKKNHLLPNMNSEALQEFCQAVYNLLVKAKETGRYWAKNFAMIYALLAGIVMH